MSFTSLTTKIKLAYPPISAYTFETLKEEEIVQEYFKSAMIYVLAQRAVLSFENIKVVSFEDFYGITFEIHKQGTNSVLKCNLPFKQPNLAPYDHENIFIEVGSQTENPDDNNDIHGIKFFDVDENFLFWVSPDKFIYDVLNNVLEGKIEGNLEEFISFKVHYVGKATEQNIWKRLTGHYTLQKILTMQKPIIKGDLPAHEITLLLLKVEHMLSVKVQPSYSDYIQNNLPSRKEVSLDIEKMLVKLLNPEYNHPTKRFPNYPKSTDGLEKFKFNKFSYQLLEPVVLEYNEIEICGNIDEKKADLILIKDNQSMEIVKLK